MRKILAGMNKRKKTLARNIPFCSSLIGQWARPAATPRATTVELVAVEGDLHLRETGGPRD